LPHYTYNDYVHWEGRWELMDGHPIAMSPMPVPKHQRAAVALSFELELAIRQAKCKTCKVYEPLDYKIREDTILQPDLLIICKPIKKQFLDFPPDVVVEILSPSTALRDRNTKFDLYQQEGVKYYLIVDVEKEQFSLYELQNDEYKPVQQDFSKPYVFVFNSKCKISVILSEVWENI
jgi:Uma2 family endonuclease